MAERARFPILDHKTPLLTAFRNSLACRCHALGYNPCMESKSVTLMLRFKDADGKWKRRPVARGANGRVKPGHVLIDGKPVTVRDGAYVIRQIVNRQPVYLPAGKQAAVAGARRQKLEDRELGQGSGVGSRHSGGRVDRKQDVEGNSRGLHRQRFEARRQRGCCLGKAHHD